MITLSLDSQGSEAGRAKLWHEVEETLGRAEDPLEILIAEEETDPFWHSDGDLY